MGSRTFTFITIHPELIKQSLDFGVFQRAQKTGQAKFAVVNLRDHAVDGRGSIDDTPYGGGEGMVMRVDPLASAVESIKSERPNSRIILLSPGGKKFDQRVAQGFAESSEDLVFVCGRFGGVDERFVAGFVDLELSLGDFVVAGGELPALTIVEAVVRLLPGVLGSSDSAEKDSFASAYAGLLEHPQYTRPPEFRGMKVPDVLLSGDHGRIAEWQKQQRLARTERLRPDLLGRTEYPTTGSRNSDLSVTSAKETTVQDEPIVFFDGVCSLCNHAVDWLLRHDTRQFFKVASLQGETAKAKLSEEVRSDMDSIVVFDGGEFVQRSSAIVAILRGVGGVYGFFGAVLGMIPRPIRDFGYKVIAANRYKLFGRRETCRLPSAAERTVFLP